MNPARLAVCHTKSDISTLRLRMARAWLVARNMCGRTLPAAAAHRADGHTRLGPPRHRHAIPERLDREPQDVEADGDVAHRGGCERRRASEGRRGAHSRAPR